MPITDECRRKASSSHLQVIIFSPLLVYLFVMLSVGRTSNKIEDKWLGFIPSCFDLIEIEAAWDKSKPLIFYFVRRSINAEQNKEVDEKWRKDDELKVA